MEELVAKLAEILEVETLDVKSKFSDYEAWDSLAILYIISMLDSDYHVVMSADQLKQFDTIESFCKAVLNK